MENRLEIVRRWLQTLENTSRGIGDGILPYPPQNNDFEETASTHTSTNGVFGSDETESRINFDFEDLNEQAEHPTLLNLFPTGLDVLRCILGYVENFSGIKARKRRCNQDDSQRSQSCKRQKFA